MSCGTKRNTPLSRNWQAFTTRYNVFYNGEEHFRNQLQEMEKNYEDDYSQLLPLHPAEARGNDLLPQPQGDFRRTIEKMQKAIELHSITRKPQKRSKNQSDRDFRAREEFNPFLHNAWMRMGEALYYDGDFMTASTTFLYISRHFQWLPDIVTEARLWQAASYCALGWLHEAENVLRLVREKNITNDKLKNLDSFVRADLLIRQGEYSSAVNPLESVAENTKGIQKHRLYFLLGQIYSRLGEREKAFEAFGKASSGIGVPQTLKIAARIRQSEVYAGTDINSEIKALSKMTRYERNREFLDLIHYAIGNLYMTQRDTAQAIKNYSLAISKSTREGTDAALAKLALGNIYFSRSRYDLAQPLLSEAASSLPKDYPGIKVIAEKSEILDELALYAQNVHLQDSLLAIAALTRAEQDDICRKLADNYVKHMKQLKDDEEREKALENSSASLPIENTSTSKPLTFSSSNDNSWYFYNPALVSAGKTEFQKKWGARKLEDNWRRREKSTFSIEDEDYTEDTNLADNNDIPDSSGKEILDSVSDPASPKYYLASIPSTPEEIKSSNSIIEEGLYNMGVILKDRLDNYSAARNAFMQLESRYPDNPFRLEVLHDMYLMAVRDDNREDATKWRKFIISDFPDSRYAKAIADPDYFTRLRDMNRIQSELYDRAYSAYLENRNKEVREIVAELRRLYPLSPMTPKFLFLDALASLTEGDSDSFKNELSEIVKNYPASDVAEVAGGMLKRLKEGGVPNGGDSNPRSILWQTRLSDNDYPEEDPDSIPQFRLDTESPQYLVLVFPKETVNSNQVIYDIARFNFTRFSVRDFDLEQMGFKDVGLVIVKGFNNSNELHQYVSLLEKEPNTLPTDVNPVMISKEDFDILIKNSRSFEDYFRFREEEETQKLENKILGN